MKNLWINRDLAAEKKILYVALAAMMLISCDPNAPKIPSKDNKMLDKLSLNFLSFVGEKKKNVVSTLEDLGFQELDNSGSLPARLGKPAQKADGSYINFFYGNIDVYEEAAEEEDWEIFDDYLIEKKEIAVMVSVYYGETNLVNEVYVELYTANDVKNINNLYGKFSKNVFLALDEDKEWAARLIECEDAKSATEKDFQEFNSVKKREKFEAAFAEMEFPYVEEVGSDEFDETTRRKYNNYWISDFGELSKDMDGLCYGAFDAWLSEVVTPEP